MLQLNYFGYSCPFIVQKWKDKHGFTMSSVTPPFLFPTPSPDTTCTSTALPTNLSKSTDRDVYFSEVSVSISPLDHEPLEEGRVSFVIIVSQHLAQCLAQNSRRTLWVNAIKYLKQNYLLCTQDSLSYTFLIKGQSSAFLGHFVARNDDCTHIILFG